MHLFLVAGINAFGQILVQLRREVNLDTVCRPSRDAGTKKVGIEIDFQWLYDHFQCIEHL